MKPTADRRRKVKSKRLGVKQSGAVKKTVGVSKGQSKATKVQIERMNADFEGLQQLQMASQKPASVLDVKHLKQELTKDKEKKDTSKKAEADLAAQLEMITGMEL
ncbi:hypothetical protein PSN45_002412 [Yamadazyma tenuis]|uniref:uncharacterized protein n=1 Tax=Candida tenuis TaxID=2315449 RepID=UPI0027A9283E|nr:hypothetical protein PSN45_002412 [Yamadazyma tenuis]